MRIALVAVMVVSSLAACGLGDGDDAARGCVWRGERHPPGARFPAGDGCNTCSCEADGQVRCTLIACVPPDAGSACAPSGACAQGPACGTGCCGAGEQCVDGACRCGDSPGCDPGDTCAAAGPVGGDACGVVCCGTSGPCPL